MLQSPPVQKSPASRNDSDLRHSDHAETVGYGVHRQRVSPGPAPEKEDPNKPRSLDGPIEWTDTPTFPDQISRGPLYWKLDRLEAKVFDLSKPEDLKAYSDLLSETSKPDANKSLMTIERKYDEEIHSWRVLVEIQYIKFRKLLKTERNE